MQGGGKGARSSGRLCGPKEGVGVELKARERGQLQDPQPACLPVSPKLTSFYRPWWECL